jgi:hypothetical protein
MNRGRYRRPRKYQDLRRRLDAARAKNIERQLEKNEDKT